MSSERLKPWPVLASDVIAKELDSFFVKFFVDEKSMTERFAFYNVYAVLNAAVAATRHDNACLIQTLLFLLISFAA